MAASQPFVPQLSQPIICVVGPTASGKSALAQELARRLDGAVISADSMQVYRGMDIGTGKLTQGERTVPHFGLDLVEPGTPYSVALFQEYARRTAAELDAQGKRVILCGGTGLYVRGVIDGYEYPKGDQDQNPVRREYYELLDRIGEQALWERLKQTDPASAQLIHPNNTRRVIRAFELLAEGSSYARQKENLAHIPQVVPAIQIGLAVDRQALIKRIDARVDAMVAEGLVDEVKDLMAAGFSEALTAPQAIGYKEIVAALRGECTLEEAVEQIKIATHRYAKRQRSWFGRDARIHWIDAALPGEASGLAPKEGGEEKSARTASAASPVLAASASVPAVAPTSGPASLTAGNCFESEKPQGIDSLVQGALAVLGTIDLQVHR